MSVGGDQWAVLVPNYVADGVDSGGDAGRHGACAVRVVCNPFRVGARAGEVPVTALRLPPAIFCQPCRLRRRVPAFRRSGFVLVLRASCSDTSRIRHRRNSPALADSVDCRSAPDGLRRAAFMNRRGTLLGERSWGHSIFWLTCSLPTSDCTRPCSQNAASPKHHDKRNTIRK